MNERDTELLALILMLLPRLSIAEVDVLALALQARKQGLLDDVMVRGIVEDSRRSPAHQPSSALGPDRGQGQIHNHGGWVDAIPLKQQPGIDLIDKMIANQDAIDHTRRRG
jgi:hypothetical protein